MRGGSVDQCQLALELVWPLALHVIEYAGELGRDGLGEALRRLCGPTAATQRGALASDSRVRNNRCAALHAASCSCTRIRGAILSFNSRVATRRSYSVCRFSQNRASIRK